MAKVPPKIVKDFITRYKRTLEPHIKVESMILFGSYARGEQGRYSDIDLIVISPDFKRMGYMDRMIWLSKMRGDKFINRAMDVLGYTKEEFGKMRKESAVLDEAWREGVRIK